MSEADIVQVWKDEEYRESLSEAQRAQLPENPVGAVELPDSELNSVAGGFRTAGFRRPTQFPRRVYKNLRELAGWAF